jgi:hypothetical protein
MPRQKNSPSWDKINSDPLQDVLSWKEQLSKATGFYALSKLEKKLLNVLLQRLKRLKRELKNVRSRNKPNGN